MPEKPDPAARREEILAAYQIDLDALLALEGLSEATDACIFLSGSIAERMGNRCSDLDVFVVGSATPRGSSVHRAGDAAYSVHLLGHRRVDFEYWSEPSLERVAAKLRDLALDDELDRENVLLERRMTEEEIVLIHRIDVGLPLVHAERFARLRGAFDLRRLADYLREVKLREVDDAHEDACGMLDDLDIDVGIMRCRDLVNAACDALCHHLGSTNIRYKWRCKILASYAQEARVRELSERSWRLGFPDAARLRADAGAFRAYVEECVRFANDITDWIQP